jgi:hypothetical protein
LSADLNFDIVKTVRQRKPAIDFASAVDAEAGLVEGKEQWRWSSLAW